MRLPILLLAAALGGGSLLTARSAAEREVRVPLEAYLHGHRHGDADAMRRAFHPSARMTYIADTGMVTVPIGDYIARIRPRAEPDTFPREITMVDMQGSAAIARIELRLATVTFTDYMTLLRFDDGWRIVNKSFHRE